MKIRCLLIISSVLFACSVAIAQQRIPLYTDSIPNSISSDNLERDEPNAVVDSLTFHVTRPSMTVFFPEKERSNGTVVIICPGGGYHVLLTKREGSDVARAFNEQGVTAIVLRYRLPDDNRMHTKYIGPLQDLQQAILITRQRSEEWGIDTDRIGVMGFSAGGHLAATAGTHHTKSYIPNPNQISLRPNFMLLINPVVSFSDTVGHLGSRNNLLGNNPESELVRCFSNELNVNTSTPPTFLVHAATDEVVPVENSLLFYQALHRYKVPAGIHIYAKGEHGFLTAPSFEEWFGRCLYWMQGMELLTDIDLR